MEFKKGDRVRWASQASGFAKVKVGVFIKVVQPLEDVRFSLPEGVNTPPNHIKAQAVSSIARALVKVPRGGKSKIADYYCPRLSALDRMRCGGGE